MNTLKYLFILSSLLLTACETDQVLITSPVDLQSSKKSNTMNYPGKPVAAVNMSYSMEKNIQAGNYVDIILTFTNSIDVDDLLVNYKSDAGLTVDGALQQQSFGVLAAGEASTLTLRAMANNNGFYYIYVTATLITDKQQGRSFVIPVNVGNVNAKQSLKTNGNVETDSSGRKIISMPAEMVH